MFFLDAGDKFFITLWRSCDAGDKFSITLWRSCDAEFITLSAEQRRDKVNYHPPSLTNKLGNNGDHAWMKTIKTCWLKVDNLLLLYLFWHTDCRLKQQTSMIRTHFIRIVWHWQAIIRGPFQRTLLLPVIFWTTSKSKPSLLLRKWQRQVPIFLSIICQWSRNDLFSKMVK